MGARRIYRLGAVGKNLPVQQYELLGVFRRNVHDGAMPLLCDHCGTVIVSFANIIGLDDHKQYRIGLDCLSRLMDSGMRFKGLYSSTWESMHKDIKKYTKMVLDIQKDLDKQDPKDVKVSMNIDTGLSSLTFNFSVAGQQDWRSHIPLYCQNLFDGLIEKYSSKDKLKSLINEYKKEAKREGHDKYYELNAHFTEVEYLKGYKGVYSKLSKFKQERQKIALINIVKPKMEFVKNEVRKFFAPKDEDETMLITHKIFNLYGKIVTVGFISQDLGKWLVNHSFYRIILSKVLGIELPDGIRKIQAVDIEKIDLEDSNK